MAPLINMTGISSWLAQQGATALAKIVAVQTGNIITQILLAMIGIGGFALIVGGIIVFVAGKYITKPLGIILIILGIVMVLPALLLYL